MRTEVTTRRELSKLRSLVYKLTALAAVLAVLCTVFFIMWRKSAKKVKELKNQSSQISSAESSESAQSQNSADSADKVTSAESASETSSAAKTSSKSKTQSSAPAAASTASSDSNSKMSVEALAAQRNNWNLLLVNPQNPLPENFSIKTANIAASYARDVGMKYDSRAVGYLNSMCAAAEKDGVSLLVISCYRPHSRQVALFNSELEKTKKNNPGISEDAAVKKAATVVAYPGTSEHEVGLAIDFNSDQQSFEKTKQFAWLKQHAADYGFVLRFPKDKSNITGIIYEPWHYRYVGKDHAKKMNELGYCLEEYCNYLKSVTK